MGFAFENDQLGAGQNFDSSAGGDVDGNGLVRGAVDDEYRNGDTSHLVAEIGCRPGFGGGQGCPEGTHQRHVLVPFQRCVGNGVAKNGAAIELRGELPRERGAILADGFGDAVEDGGVDAVGVVGRLHHEGGDGGD